MNPDSSAGVFSSPVTEASAMASARPRSLIVANLKFGVSFCSSRIFFFLLDLVELVEQDWTRIALSSAPQSLS